MVRRASADMAFTDSWLRERAGKGDLCACRPGWATHAGNALSFPWNRRTGFARHRPRRDRQLHAGPQDSRRETCRSCRPLRDRSPLLCRRPPVAAKLPAADRPPQRVPARGRRGWRGRRLPPRADARGKHRRAALFDRRRRRRPRPGHRRKAACRCRAPGRGAPVPPFCVSRSARTMPAAIRLYERRGYARIGTLPRLLCRRGRCAPLSEDAPPGRAPRCRPRKTRRSPWPIG